MSVGDEEEFEPRLAPWRLTSGFYRFAALMRESPVLGLKLQAEVLPGERHATAWATAFSRGVRALLGARAPAP